MTVATGSDATQATTALALRITLLLSLAVAGAIHLALTSEHVSLSPALAIGFFAAGLIQVALAIALIRRAWRKLVLLAAATSAIFIGAFVYDVTFGLPMVSHAAVHADAAPHSHAEEVATHQAAHPADPALLLAKTAEAMALTSAGVLLVRNSRPTRLAGVPPTTVAKVSYD